MDEPARSKLKFFLGLGLLVALILLSSLKQNPDIAVHQFAMVLALVTGMMVLDFFKVSQFVRIANSRRATHRDAIRDALAATLKSPLLVRIFGSQVLVLYYAFFAKSAANCPRPKDNRFDYAKSSNARDVYLFFALSQLPFLPLIHILVEHRIGPGAAWLISLLTLWSVVWFLAQVEAVRYRPVELTADHLRYCFGLAWTAVIPLDRIRSARSVDVTETLHANDMFLSPFGSARNVIIEFDGPVEFSGPFLQKRSERRAAICLDHPARFLRQLGERGVSIGQ